MELDHKDSADALFDSTYMRWFHLNGKPSLVKIVKVEKCVEMTLPGGIPAKKPVVTVEQVKGDITDMKPLVLNKTNARAIAAIASNKPSQWKGAEIVLTPTTTKMWNKDLKRMDEVGCIRIRAKKDAK
jgi:hypothetical protein